MRGVLRTAHCTRQCALWCPCHCSQCAPGCSCQFSQTFLKMGQSRRTTLLRCGCRSTPPEKRKRRRAQAHRTLVLTLQRKELQKLKKTSPGTPSVLWTRPGPLKSESVTACSEVRKRWKCAVVGGVLFTHVTIQTQTRANSRLAISRLVSIRKQNSSQHGPNL